MIIRCGATLPFMFNCVLSLFVLQIVISNYKLQWLVVLLEVMIHCLQHSALLLLCYLSAMFIYTLLHPNSKLKYLPTSTNGQMSGFFVLPNK